MLEQLVNHENESIKERSAGPQLWAVRKKIMVIDDDMDFRLAVSEILVDHGFDVMTAKDGEKAIDILLHERELPDLILVDLIMPVKSGLEFRREQEKYSKIANIPVVFVSGHGIVDGEISIQKPFDSEEFIDKLNQYI